MKCGGKHDTTWNIPHSITFSPRYISCYIAENHFPLGQCGAEKINVRFKKSKNYNNIYFAAHTKHPKTKRPKGQNVQRDKTSQGTKRPKGQNVPRDKTSQGQNVPGTKRPRDKTSQGTKRPKGQNVPRDKTSKGTKRPRDKTSQGTKRPKGTNEANYITWCGQLPNPIWPG